MPRNVPILTKPRVEGIDGGVAPGGSGVFLNTFFDAID
jgi:hypothetical protein